MVQTADNFSERSAVFVLTVSFSLPAFAKINLFLRVIGKREDSYHEIETVFQTISLKDVLTFTERSDDLIKLSCDDGKMPVDESNLVVRAATEFQKRFDIKRGVSIHLEKKIPSPGGLGGGSSDAAITLLGLAKLWDVKIEKKELEEIGSSLGADVPFFFTGGTALGTQLGNSIMSLDDIPKTLFLVVTPNVNVATKEAYKSLNSPSLTKENPKSILSRSRWRETDTDSVQEYLHNDFESVIFRLEPEIERVKRALIEQSANGVLMSGSGASVFGIFDKEEVREQAVERLKQEKSWRIFACSSVGRREYLKALEPCSKIMRV